MIVDTHTRPVRRTGILLALLAALLFPLAAHAYVSEEYFDSDWAPPFPWASAQNGTNTVTGWTVGSVWIRSNAGATSSTNAATMTVNGGWIQSPLLTNGAGIVSFQARYISTAQTLSLEVSYDGSLWTTNQQFSITTTAFAAYSGTINSQSNQYVRLRRVSSASGYPAVDDVTISGPPPVIAISNTTLAPASPADLDSVNVSTLVGITGIKDSLYATNYWREWPGSTWTAIAMATNGLGGYTTVTSLPGKAIGTVMEYYIGATCVSDGTTYTTNGPVLSYVVRPQSGYTNLWITPQINTNMLIGANRSWQRALSLSNAVNTTFRFQGYSNGIATVWGDTNQTSATIPAYGTAEANATNILLAGTNTGALTVSFNESTLAYSVMACDYVNFDAWTGPSYDAYGNYTNANWIVLGGSTSNDTARAMAGRSLILNGQQGGATNTYLLSPQLSNGIGQISFWYRNWSTNGSPAGRLDIQVAASPGTTNWQTIASVTGIISTNYLFYSLGRSDRENQYVRILNNANGASSRVCLDEVVVARPGAGIVASGVTNTPAAPTVLDTVDITATLTPMSGAGLTNVVLWYRMGSDGNFDTVSMSTTNGLLWKSDSMIPRAGTGVVQYAIQCFYTGFQSESSSPQWVPSTGTNTPFSYTVADISFNRIENFNANWSPTLPWGSAQNGTNTLTDWRASGVIIRSTPSSYSTPYAASLFNADSWVQSCLLSNGVGTISFWARYNAGIHDVAVESSYDGVTWITNQVHSPNTSPTFAPYSTTIATTSNVYIRLHRVTSGTGYPVIDDVYIPFPPADVAISNLFINPGYPSQDATVTATCEITSINSLFPAWAITPTLQYRKLGTTAFTVLPMSRVSGSLYSTAPFTIPAFPRDTTIEYFVRCDFKGYYGSDLDRRSPRFSPAGGSNAPSSYVVRQFASAYSNVTAVMNSTSQYSRLLDNGLWQTVVTLPSDTNSLGLAFNGLAYGIGSGYSTNPVFWGNSSNWQSAFPLSEYSGTGQTAFAIDGIFGQGQEILFRFDESTGLYLIIPCVFQDFDAMANSSLYILKLVGASTSAPPVSLTFTSWPTNTARVRFETFQGIRWGDYTTAYADGGIGGDDFFVIYGAKINTSAGYSVEMDPSDTKGFRWVAQIADEGNPPFRGMEYLKYSYRALSLSSNLITMGVYFFPTSASHSANYYDLTEVAKWAPLTTNIAVTNTGFINITNTLQTSTTYNVIFSQDTGTNSLLVDTIEMKEWYSQHFTNDGWIATHSWIEDGPAGRVCRMESTRANPAGSSQYLQTPLLSNGIYVCSVDFSAGANGSAAFDLQIAYETPSSWTNVGQVVTNVSNPGSNYLTASFTLLVPITNAYLRVVNKTAAPGSLLVKKITVEPNVQGETWKLNNIALLDNDARRRYYETACFLNNSRTANLGTPLPDTNTYAYVRSPPIPYGIGEISFWYRNWTISGSVPPAKIVIQTCATASTNDLDWTTVGLITNVVNTNDYLYYRTSVYDTNSQFVRIYNDDITVSNAGRVCLDDVLITAPMASTLSMSNLTVSPLFPLYTNTVDVLVDVYHLFLAPSNIALLAIHGSATNYDGLATASVSSIPMTCIASNLSVPGKWYRYKTTTQIPTNAIDTYVKYSARATFDGFHTGMTSPKTNRLFAVYPAWYDPMNAIYGTNQSYYVVYSCPTGTVWFNEINYIDDVGGTYTWTNEYVELCGLTGVNLRNWRVEILDSYGVTIGTYQITNNFILPNDTNSHGFWVLGDAIVANVDMAFTNYYDEGYGGGTTQNLPYGGGLVLRRSTGAYEDRVTYGPVEAWTGFTYAGDVQNGTFGQLALTGSATNRAGLSWAYPDVTSYTPGGINPGQTLWGLYIADSGTPVILITSFRLDTNVWITCNTTNNWFPVPWYSTNLMSTNSWTNVPAFNRNIVTTNCTINFAKPTNSTPYFYRVVATNSP